MEVCFSSDLNRILTDGTVNHNFPSTYCIYHTPQWLNTLSLLLRSYLVNKLDNQKQLSYYINAYIQNVLHYAPF